jgi:hypothetical protein
MISNSPFSQCLISIPNNENYLKHIILNVKSIIILIIVFNLIVYSYFSKWILFISLKFVFIVEL